MFRRVWWSAFGRGIAGVLVGLLLAALLWHGVQDHRALHRMIGLWNQYGPLLQQAQQARKTPAAPAAPHAAQEK